MSDSALISYLTALADDELILGHRDSEWTGYAPILEEDIAFSNIAQDEIGHALALYTLAQELGGKNPDAMAFERPWKDFSCCRFVTYPKGDFAYTVVRQYLYDEAELVRMQSHAGSSFGPLRDLSEKILAEEAYHLMHSKGLVERLGNATGESHRRMQAAVDTAFPQALGLFEPVHDAKKLIDDGVVRPDSELMDAWLKSVVPTLESAGLRPPVRVNGASYDLSCKPEYGGRTGNHAEYLRQIVADLQQVYKMAPGGSW
ncbi:MAG: phenylacetate-CoA oxygenase subunit PaaC [Ignavibacterium sp.]